MTLKVPVSAFKKLSVRAIKDNLPIEVISDGQPVFWAVPPGESQGGGPEPDREKIREILQRARDKTLTQLGHGVKQSATFTHKLKVCSADETRCEEFEAVVDTGSTLTTIPRGMAKRLGLRHLPGHWAERPTIADGTQVYRPVYEAVVIMKGRKAIQPVWEGPVPVIGMFTLELAGFIVNPQTMALEEMKILGK